MSAFLKGRLGAGKTLSATALQVVDFSSGRFGCIVPGQYSDSAVLEPDRGHLPGIGARKSLRVGNIEGAAVQTVTSKAELSDVISGALQPDASYCLVEDGLARPADPWLADSGLRIGSYASDVYFLIGKDERGALNDFVQRIHSHFSIGVAGPAIRADYLARKDRIKFTLDEIRELAQAATLVFTPAFDGEGYVYWKKNAKLTNRAQPQARS